MAVGIYPVYMRIQYWSEQQSSSDVGHETTFNTVNIKTSDFDTWTVLSTSCSHVRGLS